MSSIESEKTFALSYQELGLPSCRTIVLCGRNVQGRSQPFGQVGGVVLCALLSNQY